MFHERPENFLNGSTIHIIASMLCRVCQHVAQATAETQVAPDGEIICTLKHGTLSGSTALNSMGLAAIHHAPRSAYFKAASWLPSVVASSLAD